MKKSPKTNPKPLQNPSQKHPENTSKIDATNHRLWSPNEPRNEPTIFKKSIQGALWGPMASKETQKRGPGIPGHPKGRSRANCSYNFHHLLDLFCMFSRIIHDRLSTLPNYVRTNIQRQKMKTRSASTNKRNRWKHHTQESSTLLCVFAILAACAAQGT